MSRVICKIILSSSIPATHLRFAPLCSAASRSSRMAAQPSSSSSSSPSSPSPSAAIDFLTLCHSLKVSDSEFLNQCVLKFVNQLYVIGSQIWNWNSGGENFSFLRYVEALQIRMLTSILISPWWKGCCSIQISTQICYL